MSHNEQVLCKRCKLPFTRRSYFEDYLKYCPMCREKRTEILERRVFKLMDQVERLEGGTKVDG